MPEQHPAGFEAMVQTIYHSGYDLDRVIAMYPEVSDVMLNVHAYAIADYCELD